MVDDTKDNGTLPDLTPRPAPAAESTVPVVAASPAPTVAPAGDAAHATEQAPAKTAARRARKLVTTALADATPAPAASPALAVKAPVPVTVAAPKAEDAAKTPASAPKKAIAAKPLPVRKGPAKAVPVKPEVVPVPPKAQHLPKAQPLAKATPLVATRPGTGIPHAKVPAPLKTRVTHAAAPAASRKEHPIMTTANEFSEKFQSAFKDASEKAKTAFEKSQAAFGDAGEFAKGNVEAVVESSKILAAGLQELTKGYAAEGKSAMETLTAEIKELASAKSPTEFFEKHTALMRKQFDAAVAASSKHSEAVLKLANEAFQPISNRVSLAVEKMKVAA